MINSSSFSLYCTIHSPRTSRNILIRSKFSMFFQFGVVDYLSGGCFRLFFDFFGFFRCFLISFWFYFFWFFFFFFFWLFFFFFFFWFLFFFFLLLLFLYRRLFFFNNLFDWWGWFLWRIRFFGRTWFCFYICCWY